MQIGFSQNKKNKNHFLQVMFRIFKLSLQKDKLHLVNPNKLGIARFALSRKITKNKNIL